MPIRREHLAGAERLLQIKTTDERNRDQWGEPGTDAVPENYLAQVTWEMGVAGVPLCDVAVLFGRREFGIYTVPFNADLFEGMLEIVERFEVEHVRAQVPPPADAGDVFAGLLKTRFPVAFAPVRVASPMEVHVAQQFALWREVESRAKSFKKRYGNELRSAIGDAMGLDLGEVGKVSYKNNRDTSKIDWKAVAEELHGLAGKFSFELEHPEGFPSLSDFLTRHTTKGPGARVLRPTFIGPAEYEGRLLELEIDEPDKHASEDDE